MDKNKVEREDILKYFELVDHEPTGREYTDLVNLAKSLNSLRKLIDNLDNCYGSDELRAAAEDVAWEASVVSEAADEIEKYASVSLDEYINVIRHRLDPEEVEEILESKVICKLKGK